MVYNFTCLARSHTINYLSVDTVYSFEKHWGVSWKSVIFLACPGRIIGFYLMKKIKLFELEKRIYPLF